MRRHKVLPSRNRLKKLYEKNNLSIRKLAKIYACGATTIQRKLHNYDIAIRPSMSIKIDIPRDRLKFLYGNSKKTSAQLAKLYSCSPTTILNRFKEYNIKTRDVSAAHIKYPKKDFAGNLLEKAYLIGFRLGDLHIRKYEKNGKVISVECGSTRPEQIMLIRNLFKDYGYVRITSSDRSKITRIQCALNQSFNFLLPKKDRIESWILSNDRWFFSFLAGYIDAEGDLGVYSKTASLRVGSYDKNILSQIQNKLEKKGINATLRLETPKGTKVNLPKSYYGINKEYRMKGDFWRIAVYRKKDLLKLLSCVGHYFRHPRMKIGAAKVKRDINLRNQKFGYLRME